MMGQRLACASRVASMPKAFQFSTTAAAARFMVGLLSPRPISGTLKGSHRELPFTVAAFLHASIQHQLFGSLEIVFPPTGSNVFLDGVGIGWHQVAQALAGQIGNPLGGGWIVGLVVLPANLDGEVIQPGFQRLRGSTWGTSRSAGRGWRRWWRRLCRRPGRPGRYQSPGSAPSGLPSCPGRVFRCCR